MKIVIDVPNSVYENIINGTIETDGYFKANLKECFKSGTLLPKYHGRLIDADKLPKCCGSPEYDCCGECENCSDYVVYVDDIKNAPTIIEADKG